MVFDARLHPVQLIVICRTIRQNSQYEFYGFARQAAEIDIGRIILAVIHFGKFPESFDRSAADLIIQSENGIAAVFK